MDGVQVVPQERVQNCSLDQFVDVPVPQIMAKLGVSVRPVPLERIQERSWSRFLWCPRPRRNRVCCSTRASGAYPRTTRAANFCGVPDHGLRMHPGSDRGGASAPDHGENCG